MGKAEENVIDLGKAI